MKPNGAITVGYPGRAVVFRTFHSRNSVSVFTGAVAPGEARKMLKSRFRP